MMGDDLTVNLVFHQFYAYLVLGERDDALAILHANLSGKPIAGPVIL
jgi:hypothetical protein